MKIVQKDYTIALALLFTITLCACGEETLITYGDGALDGYTMLCATGVPGRTIPPLVIIDMQGNHIEHQYSEIAGYLPRMMAGGTIIGPSGLLTSTGSGDIPSLVQERWDGTVEWSFSQREQLPGGEWSARGHHDFQREGCSVGYYAPGQSFMKQGNTLILGHKNETRPEISNIPLISDIIYEIDWDGNTVFEWNATDHIEEFGFDEMARTAIAAVGDDFLHCNAVSWLGENPWYDDGDVRFHPRNILFNSRHAGFMAIIDYQTGNIVWRVGPDYSAGNPEAALGPIIGAHHVHMIPRGLPGEGNILVFDNGGSSGYTDPDQDDWKYIRLSSRVVEFNPITTEIVWEYSPANGDYLEFSAFLSGAQRLPNGNTLIATSTNIMLEVTPEKQIVWHYKYTSFDTLALYRATRVPPEWVPGNPAGYLSWE